MSEFRNWRWSFIRGASVLFWCSWWVGQLDLLRTRLLRTFEGQVWSCKNVNKWDILVRGWCICNLRAIILKKCHNRETQDKSSVVQDYSQGHLGDDSEQKEGREWTKEQFILGRQTRNRLVVIMISWVAKLFLSSNPSLLLCKSPFSYVSLV